MLTLTDVAHRHQCSCITVVVAIQVEYQEPTRAGEFARVYRRTVIFRSVGTRLSVPRSAPRSVFRDLYCKSRRYKRGAERGTERGTDAPRRVYTYDFTVRIAEHLTRRGARNGRTCSNGTENNSSSPPRAFVRGESIVVDIIAALTVCNSTLQKPFHYADTNLHYKVKTHTMRHLVARDQLAA